MHTLNTIKCISNIHWGIIFQISEVPQKDYRKIKEESNAEDFFFTNQVKMPNLVSIRFLSIFAPTAKILMSIKSENRDLET